MSATIGRVLTLPMTDVARQPLHAEKCTLVVIDIQQRLLPPIFNKDQLIRNTSLLVRLAKILKIPTLLTTQYAKGLGSTVPEIKSLMDGVEEIDKLEFSCFGKDVFCSAVKSLPGNRNTMLLCGMETHICVMQTALGALDQGYLVHVASDAVGSRAESNWKVGIERMRDAGCVIS